MEDLAMQLLQEKSYDGCMFRFVKNCVFVNSVDKLYEQIFILMDELDLEVSLKFYSVDQIYLRSNYGQVSERDEKILDLMYSAKLTSGVKIKRFGNDRCIFTWSNVHMLVKNIGSHIDTISIVMDCLESYLKKVETSIIAERILQTIEEKTERIIFLIDNIPDDLSVEFSSMGIMGLSEQQEKSIENIVTTHSQQAEKLCRVIINQLTFLKETAKITEPTVNTIELF